MNYFFMIALSLLLFTIFCWGFQALPAERWQFLASIPRSRKGASGCWIGENLTFYGVLSATGYTSSVAFYLLLAGSLLIPLSASLAIIAGVLLVCMPASRLIARWVEGKAFTFTIGGASFVGVIAAPWLILMIHYAYVAWFGVEIPVIPLMAAISIAYALGEGLGRLACISFGCCYGKPLNQCHPVWQKLFSRLNFVFSGKTKKIAYSHDMAMIPVLPIQGITSSIYGIVTVSGAFLFLQRYYVAALLTTLIVTQLWRVISEFLRADYRGEGKISAYQIMALFSVVYMLSLTYFLPSITTCPPDIAKGISFLWNPGIILFLQGLWIASFLYTGRSKVTNATISFHVIKERV